MDTLLSRLTFKVNQNESLILKETIFFLFYIIKTMTFYGGPPSSIKTHRSFQWSWKLPRVLLFRQSVHFDFLQKFISLFSITFFLLFFYSIFIFKTRIKMQTYIDARICFSILNELYIKLFYFIFLCIFHFLW